MLLRTVVADNKLCRHLPPHRPSNRKLFGNGCSTPRRRRLKVRWWISIMVGRYRGGTGDAVFSLCIPSLSVNR